MKSKKPGKGVNKVLDADAPAAVDSAAVPGPAGATKQKSSKQTTEKVLESTIDGGIGSKSMSTNHHCCTVWRMIPKVLICASDVSGLAKPRVVHPPRRVAQTVLTKWCGNSTHLP